MTTHELKLEVKYFDDEERLYTIKECAKQALAEIGGEDD